MTNQVPPVIEILINWFPMLLLIAVWIYMMRGFRGRGGLTYSQYQTQILAEQKRHNEALEKILARLENRLPH
jgi:cell division protease FtsH